MPSAQKPDALFFMAFFDIDLTYLDMFVRINICVNMG